MIYTLWAYCEHVKGQDGETRPQIVSLAASDARGKLESLRKALTDPQTADPSTLIFILLDDENPWEYIEYLASIFSGKSYDAVRQFLASQGVGQ